MPNKIPITGIGIHNCLATTPSAFAHALRIGKCGLHHDPARLAAGYQSDLCGNVPPVSPSVTEGLRRSQRICLSEPSLYALSVARQAMSQAGMDEDYMHSHNVSLLVSNDSTAETMTHIGEVMQEHNDTRYLGAGTVFKSLNSTVSMNLAQILHVNGLALTLSAACAGGGHAIGMAKMLIDSGQSDAVIVIGAQETNIHSSKAFDALGVFAHDRVLPFGKFREGLAPSGGAACIILQREPTAEPLAYLSGYGFSNGTSLSTPDSKQELVCMRRALNDAEITCGLIDVVLAHATGTPLGDKAEAEAIRSSFTMFYPYVVATKGLTGHECWMAGVSQAVQAVLMISRKFIPATIGAKDTAFPYLNLSTKTERTTVHSVLCNAFGFGGTNSSFIITK